MDIVFFLVRTIVSTFIKKIFLVYFEHQGFSQSICLFHTLESSSKSKGQRESLGGLIKMKNITRKILTVVLLASILAVYGYMSPGNAADEEVDYFTEVTITTTATITLDKDAALVLKAQNFLLPETEHISNIRSTPDGLLIDITSEMVICSSDVDKVNVQCTTEKEEDVSSWQLERFLNKGTTNYFENTTDQTDAYEIANDFNSATYQYLAVAKARSSSTSNTQIAVSYSDALAGNISASTDTTNTTIFNRFLPVQQFLFFRLDLETTNTSRPYILNIAFDELICDAIYIYDLPAAQNMTDERYAEIYMGSSTTAENQSSYALTAEWEQIMAHGADYTENWQDNTVKGVGFKTADEFEDALKETWVQILNNEIGKLMRIQSITVGDINDYSLDMMRLNSILSGTASSELYNIFEQKLKTQGAIETVLDSVKEDTLRKFTITSSISPNVITEDDDAEQITDLSNAVLASAEKAEGKATSFSTNILDKFTNAVGKISEPLACFMAKARADLNEIRISDNWIIAIIAGCSLAGLAIVTTIIALAFKASGNKKK